MSEESDALLHIADDHPCCKLTLLWAHNRLLELERENAALKKDKEMLEMERCECLRTMSLALNNNAGQRENLRLLRILSRIRSAVDHSPDMSQATRLEWVGEYLDDALGKEAQP